MNDRRAQVILTGCRPWYFASELPALAMNQSSRAPGRRKCSICKGKVPRGRNHYCCGCYDSGHNLDLAFEQSQGERERLKKVSQSKHKFKPRGRRSEVVKRAAKVA